MRRGLQFERSRSLVMSHARSPDPSHVNAKSDRKLGVRTPVAVRVPARSNLDGSSDGL
jgi:hypothetical protein